MMGMGAGLDAIAKALGMTADELRTALKGGSTITQIAATKNVSVETIVKAVVAELTTKINDAVTAGKMTQAEADKVLANVTTRATEMVNSSGLGAGSRGRGGPQDRPGGPKGPKGSAPTTSATTTAGS